MELAFTVAGTSPVDGFLVIKVLKVKWGDLSSDYKLKPLDKLSVKTTVVNTGNTTLSNLTLEDPLKFFI